jgi:hypothetical protein
VRFLFGQRLWELAGAVSTDLSGRDVDISRRMCEHLLHLQRRTRGQLAAALAQHDRLTAAAAALAQLAEGAEAEAAGTVVEGELAHAGLRGRGLPPQAVTRRQLWEQKRALDAAMQVRMRNCC